MEHDEIDLACPARVVPRQGAQAVPAQEPLCRSFGASAEPATLVAPASCAPLRHQPAHSNLMAIESEVYGSACAVEHGHQPPVSHLRPHQRPLNATVLPERQNAGAAGNRLATDGQPVELVGEPESVHAKRE